MLFHSAAVMMICLYLYYCSLCLQHKIHCLVAPKNSTTNITALVKWYYAFYPVSMLHALLKFNMA
jgi:hypothetical protein